MGRKIDALLFGCHLLTVFCVYRSSTEQVTDTGQHVDFYTYFEHGVKAYTYQRWEICRNSMVNAITEYRRWEKIVCDCRRKCSSVERLSNDTGIEADLLFLDKFFRTFSCVNSCKRMGLSPKEMPDLSNVDMSKFDSLEPYNYLQLCAYKANEIEQAVAAAYTYFIRNPDHEVMKQNLIDYRNLPEVSDSFFKDVERANHQSLYIHGLKNYHEGVWLLVIDYMSRGVESFFKEVEDCEFLCEERHAVLTESDVPTNIPELFIKQLKCKQDCELKLSRYHDKVVDNMAADYFHYLQFAYYNMKDIKSACGSVANFLVLNPDDQVMNSNKLYYLKKMGAKEEDFIPSQVVVDFDRHRRTISQLVENFENSKMTTRVDVIPSTSEGPPYHPSQLADDDRDTSSVVQEYKDRGITITYTEADLNGPQRVVADGFASEETCGNLIKLANVAGQQGDGYRYTRINSPHTKHEMFEGMTIARGVQLVMNSQVSADIVQQYLDVTRLSQEFTKKYFGLDNLYFDFTHLVCRTSLDEDKTRQDLSHPIHADNCIIQGDGTCKRDFPAYVERDFSALLYLNDNFEGGDFFFAHQNLSASATVRPKCGRVVAFNATNYHGVKAVLSGQRCAVAIWYTLDKKFQEISHVQAQTYLDALKKEKEAAEENPQGPPMDSSSGQRSDTQTSHSEVDSAEKAKEEL